MKRILIVLVFIVFCGISNFVFGIEEKTINGEKFLKNADGIWYSVTEAGMYSKLDSAVVRLKADEDLTEEHERYLPYFKEALVKYLVFYEKNMTRDLQTNQFDSIVCNLIRNCTSILKSGYLYDKLDVRYLNELHYLQEDGYVQYVLNDKEYAATKRSVQAKKAGIQARLNAQLVDTYGMTKEEINKIKTMAQFDMNALDKELAPEVFGVRRRDRIKSWYPKTEELAVKIVEQRRAEIKEHARKNGKQIGDFWLAIPTKKECQQVIQRLFEVQETEDIKRPLSDAVVKMDPKAAERCKDIVAEYMIFWFKKTKTRLLPDAVSMLISGTRTRVYDAADSRFTLELVHAVQLELIEFHLSLQKGFITKSSVSTKNFYVKYAADLQALYNTVKSWSSEVKSLSAKSDAPDENKELDAQIKTEKNTVIKKQEWVDRGPLFTPEKILAQINYVEKDVHARNSDIELPYFSDSDKKAIVDFFVYAQAQMGYRYTKDEFELLMSLCQVSLGNEELIDVYVVNQKYSKLFFDLAVDYLKKVDTETDLNKKGRWLEESKELRAINNQLDSFLPETNKMSGNKHNVDEEARISAIQKSEATDATETKKANPFD